MTKIVQHFFLLCLFLNVSIPSYSQYYEVKKGSVSFHSDAPQGLIDASSDKLEGVIDISKRTFSFRLGIASFVGFNNPLQKEHFNENYMESERYPFSTFAGKIIEEIDLTVNGDYFIRTKGKLSIHGIERPCIIKSHITCRNKEISIKSDFIVLLADYNIKIPRIVCDKISPEINVSVTALLLPRVPS